jgi:hypothetical protein
LKEERPEDVLKRTSMKEILKGEFPIVFQGISSWVHCRQPVTINTVLAEGAELEVVRLSDVQQKNIVPTVIYGKSIFEFKEVMDLGTHEDEAKIASPLENIKRVVKNPCLSLYPSVLFRIRCKNTDGYGVVCLRVEANTFFGTEDVTSCFCSSSKYAWNDWNPETRLDKRIKSVLYESSADEHASKRRREVSGYREEPHPLYKQFRRVSGDHQKEEIKEEPNAGDRFSRPTAKTVTKMRQTILDLH